MDIIASVTHYTQLGWALVTIPAGSKAPTDYGWPEKALRRTEDAVAYYERNATHNVGLLHSASGTCALDIDHLENARTAFTAMGLDLDAILASAPRIVGRPGRGKAIFRAHRDDLKTHKLAWPNPNGKGSSVVFELRAGATQDVLPPSIHPDTMQPYAWDGPSYVDLPLLPEPLQIMWDQWDRFRIQFMDACPWKVKPQLQAPLRKRVQSEGTSVIDAYNAAHTMAALLTQFNYRQTAKDRFLSPNSTTGFAGVILFEDGTAFSHHGSDPFDSAHSFDCFELYTQCEHAGNVRNAVKAAADFLNINTDPTHNYAPEDAEHIAHGKSVAAQIVPSLRAKAPENPLAAIPDHLLSVPGILQDVVNYYETTAIMAQPQFAVQTAIALGSVAMGRRWTTSQRNFTSLFMLNIGETGCGKEHAKTVIEAMLDGAGIGNLIGPSGYTSASGVFSALLARPTHVAVIDELGRALKSAANRNMQHKADSLTAIMEAFGRQDGALRPQGYATLGLTREQQESFEKVVRRPSLTLLGMSTPDEFYGAISGGDIASGLLNRFLIVKTEIDEQMSQERRVVEISDRLKDWLREVSSAHGGEGNLAGTDTADLPPSPVVVAFTRGALDMLRTYEAELLVAKRSTRESGLDAMHNRSREIAMRISLIVARSMGQAEIGPEPMQWAIDYVRFYSNRTIAMFGEHISESDHQAAVKAVYSKVEKAGLRGITVAELEKAVRKFAALEPFKQKAVLEKLVESYGIECRNVNEGKRGRPRMAWFVPATQ